MPRKKPSTSTTRRLRLGSHDWAATIGQPRLGVTSLKIEDNHIEVSAVLLFQENIEDLISKLEAIKGLRPRAADQKKDEAAN